MSADTLGWIARELSLTLFEDGDGGRVRLIAGTQADEGDVGLTAALARAAGLPEDHDGLVTLIERARSGASGSLRVACTEGVPGRILAWSHGPRVARALFVPEAQNGAIARRAAAADVAASVTHEVANALTGIAGWARLATHAGPLPERAKNALEIVERTARHALSSARGLLATMRDAGRSSIPPGPPGPTPIGEVVLDVLEGLGPDLEASQTTLEHTLAEGVTANVEPTTVRLVVSNLVRNAIEAMGPGGRVHVRLRAAEGEARLVIEDDGPGMSPRTLARAFERYFTTKERGTGLGLSLVRDAIREAGGRLEVDSVPGRGTRFEVVWPAGEATTLRPPPLSRSSGVHLKPGALPLQVLVVDDDAAVRSMIETALGLQGASVRVAEGCQEARRLEGDFDLALVDLSLGDGRGDELIAELRASGRVERTILLTGASELDIEGAGEPDLVLRKPFELDDLVRAIERLLAQVPLGAQV